MNNIRVVCNTSPIIALLSLQELPLLWTLFHEVIIPKAVYHELCANSSQHTEQIEEIKRAVVDGNLTLYQVRNKETVHALFGKLHLGELEVIVAAKELGIKLAIIDEISARKMASDFLLDTIGIIGILLLAKEYQIISSIKPYLDYLMGNGYRISETLYQKALKRAGE